MREVIPLVLSFGIGVLLGCAFFWGLWVTLRQLNASRHPALRVMVSLLARFAITLGGFWLLAGQLGWQPMLAAAGGFLLPRLVLVRLLRPRPFVRASAL